MDLRIVIPEKYKSLFEDQDTITIEEIFTVIDELNSEIDRLKEQQEDLEADVRDNYKPIPMSEHLGIDDRDFYED